MQTAAWHAIGYDATLTSFKRRVEAKPMPGSLDEGYGDLHAMWPGQCGGWHHGWCARWQNCSLEAGSEVGRSAASASRVGRKMVCCAGLWAEATSFASSLETEMPAEVVRRRLACSRERISWHTCNRTHLMTHLQSRGSLCRVLQQEAYGPWHRVRSRSVGVEGWYESHGKRSGGTGL